MPEQQLDARHPTSLRYPYSVSGWAEGDKRWLPLLYRIFTERLAALYSPQEVLADKRGANDERHVL